MNRKDRIIKRLTRKIGGAVEDYVLPTVRRGLIGIRALRRITTRNKLKYTHVPESNQNLYLPENMAHLVSPQAASRKRRRAGSVGSAHPSAPPLNYSNLSTAGAFVNRRIIGVGSNQTSVVVAKGRKKDRQTAKLSLTKLLFPKASFSIKGYGHDILTGSSMKAVHWLAGFQDVRLFVMLPSYFNYQGRSLKSSGSQQNPYVLNSSVAAQQAGEVPTVDDMIRKGTYHTGLARAMLGGHYNYSNTHEPGSANNNVSGLQSWIQNPSLYWKNGEDERGDNRGFMRLNQVFDFFGGKQVHTFENTGNTPITLEIIEWSPRKPMMGGYRGRNSYSASVQSDEDSLINDPIQLTLMDYRNNFASSAPNWYEGFPKTDQNYNMLSSGVTFVDPATGVAVQAQQPVGSSIDKTISATDANGAVVTDTWASSTERRPIYDGSSSEPVAHAGVNDPMFRLGKPSHKITNASYKHTKPTYLTVEPGSKAVYTMYAPAFSFNSSQWNTMVYTQYATLSYPNATNYSADIDTLPNFIPLFTKFLSVRAFSSTHAHKLWGERAVGYQNELCNAGGAYVHTVDESYSFRYVPPASVPNQKVYKNNRTDNQDNFQELFYVGNATTGNEQTQDLDA